ncbi:MAG: glycosyltransferase family 9 protein [Verrucomicrobiota bacterium]|nr:glycosyltransferase family 9 protein [Verrucomicrobiota bacterium]
MSRILIIRGGAIGDFILTLPAIKLLREAFPHAHLEILGYQHIVALAQMSGYADATRSIEYSALSSFFSRDGELAPGLVEYFSSFQQIVSYLFDPDEIFARNLRRAGVGNLIVGSPKITGEEHAARQLARPLERLALYLEEPGAKIMPNDPQKIAPDLFAVHSGSGSETKNWPIDRFIELGLSLLAASGEPRLLLVGGEADEARLDQMAAALPNEKLKWAENLPLSELAALLQNCAVFLGHDSGISHLAAAVGTPCLLLFGPTDPAIWAPANPWVRVLRAPSQRMDGIDVRKVWAALRSL